MDDDHSDASIDAGADVDENLLWERIRREQAMNNVEQREQDQLTLDSLTARQTLDFALDSQWQLPSEEIRFVHTFANGVEVHVLPRGLTLANHHMFHDMCGRIVATEITLDEYLVVLTDNGYISVVHVHANGVLKTEHKIFTTVPTEIIAHQSNWYVDQLVVSPSGRVAVCPLKEHEKIALIYDLESSHGNLQFSYHGLANLPYKTRRVVMDYNDIIWAACEVRSVMILCLMAKIEGGMAEGRRMGSLYAVRASLPVMSLKEIIRSSHALPRLVSLFPFYNNNLFDPPLDGPKGVLVLAEKPFVVQIKDILTGNTHFTHIKLPGPDSGPVLDFSTAKSSYLLYLYTSTDVFFLDVEHMLPRRIGSVPIGAWHINVNGQIQETKSYHVDNLVIGPSRALVHSSNGGLSQPIWEADGWGTKSLQLQRGSVIEGVQNILELQVVSDLNALGEQWSPSRIERIIWVKAMKLIIVVGYGGSRGFSYTPQKLVPIFIEELENVDVLAAGVAGTNQQTVLVVVGRSEVLLLSTLRPKMIASLPIDGVVTSASVDSSGALLILDGGRKLIKVTDDLVAHNVSENLPYTAFCSINNKSTVVVVGSTMFQVNDYLSGEGRKCLGKYPTIDIGQESGIALVDAYRTSNPSPLCVRIYEDFSVLVGTRKFTLAEPVSIVGFTSSAAHVVLLSGHKLWLADSYKIVPLLTAPSHGLIHAACATETRVIAITDIGVAVYAPADGVWSTSVLPSVYASVLTSPPKSTNANNSFEETTPNLSPAPVDSDLRAMQWARKVQKPRLLLHVHSQGVVLALSPRPGEPLEAYDAKRLRPLKLRTDPMNARAAALWNFVAHDGRNFEYLLLTARNGFDRFRVRRSSNTAVRVIRDLKVRPPPDSEPDPSTPKYIYTIGNSVFYGGPRWHRRVEFKAQSSGKSSIDFGEVQDMSRWDYGDTDFWSLCHVWGDNVLVQTRDRVFVSKLANGKLIPNHHAAEYYPYLPNVRPGSRSGVSRLVRGELGNVAFAACAVSRGLFTVTVDKRIPDSNHPMVIDKFTYAPRTSWSENDPDLCAKALVLCPQKRDRRHMWLLAVMGDSTVLRITIGPEGSVKTLSEGLPTVHLAE